MSPNLSKAGTSLPRPLCLNLVALPISGGSCQPPHFGETRRAEPLDFSVMKSDCLDLVFSPAVMCWIKIDALRTSPIVLGVFEGEATWLPWDIEEIGHFSCLPTRPCPARGQVSTASMLFPQAVPGENRFALILVILEGSPPEPGTWGRDAAGADYWGHGVGQAPLRSLQWRPFPHANFTRRILLLFIFFIISYLSLPDVFRAVFFCVVN